MATFNPARMDGSTVAFVTDMHNGYHPQTAHMHNRMGTDLDWLQNYCKVMGLAGDNINWRNLSPSAEDTNIKNFLAARTNKAKYLVTSGNHDLASANESILNPNRTANAWASATGVPKYNHYPLGDTVASGLQVVTLSQEEMRFNQWLSPAAAALDTRASVKPGRGFVLSAAALAYLRARLDTGRPTWIMIHYPLVQHVGSTKYWHPDTINDMNNIITSYDNIIGVLSGHYHRLISNSYGTNRTSVTANGKTKIVAGLNGPSAGGPDGSAEYTEQPVYAMVATYRPGWVMVRWRDLMNRRWVRGTLRDGTQDFVSEFSISCQVPITF